MTRPNARRALVTGGHGFLGSHLVDLLLERGFTVRCLLRQGRSEAALGGRRVEVWYAHIPGIKVPGASTLMPGIRAYHPSGLWE